MAGVVDFINFLIFATLIDLDMDNIRYPIGIQTFSKIIEEGYTYIDKTQFIPKLLNHGQYLFMGRPRRFGKSLLLSTLEAFFEGKRELFNGLAVDRMNIDWTPSPVIRLDFNAENYSLEDGLERKFDTLFHSYESYYGCDPALSTPSQRFNNLVRNVYKQTDRKVVILIDEYDKPLLDIEDKPEIFEKNQRILKSVYGNLKSLDKYIRFAFIIGVARFNKISIFSDLNHLDDISLDNEFADICGWTEEELVDGFRPGIEKLAEEMELGFDETLKSLRTFYDGYLFAPKGSRLYNPFSVLLALKSKEIEPYWFETGSPSFLVRRVKAMGVYPPDLNGQKCSRKELSAVGMNDKNPVPLMFQTGYLTIDSYIKNINMYTLRFPNREVEMGFFTDLLPVYAPDTNNTLSPLSYLKFMEDLYTGRPNDFMERLAVLLKNLPGEDHSESTYRAVTYLVAILCNTKVIAEHHSYLGRSDLEVITGNYIYLFEFKYNKSVTEAINQIKSRDYAGRYKMEARKIYLIAANYNENKPERGLQYEIESL